MPDLSASDQSGSCLKQNVSWNIIKSSIEKTRTVSSAERRRLLSLSAIRSQRSAGQLKPDNARARPSNFVIQTYCLIVVSLRSEVLQLCASSTECGPVSRPLNIYNELLVEPSFECHINITHIPAHRLWMIWWSACAAHTVVQYQHRARHM